MRFLRISAVCEKTSLGRTAIWKLEKSGGFPKRRRVGPNRVAWLESEVEAWMEARALVCREERVG